MSESSGNVVVVPACVSFRELGGRTCVVSWSQRVAGWGVSSPLGIDENRPRVRARSYLHTCSFDVLLEFYLV